MSSEQVLERYAEAVERRRLLVERWEADGRPLITLGGATGRAEVPHPLVRMIAEADALCDRLWKSTLDRRQPGRPAGSTHAADRAAPPPKVRLRSVGA